VRTGRSPAHHPGVRAGRYFLPVTLATDGYSVHDKERARVNAMRHVLGKFDYDDKDHEVVGEADPLIVGRALAD
jgi:hypothetical protein